MNLESRWLRIFTEPKLQNPELQNKLISAPKRKIDRGTLKYTVATTNDVLDVCPEVVPILEEVGRKILPSNYVLETEAPNGINVNRLDPPNGYEYHLDSRGITIVTFLDDHPLPGGELAMFYLSENRPILIPATCGTSVIFTGRTIPHQVMPVTRRRCSLVAIYRRVDDVFLPEESKKLFSYLFGED